MEEESTHTTESPTEEDVPYEEEVAGDESPDNLLKALRASRKAIGEDDETFLDIPGYNGQFGLVCQYRRLDYDEADKIAEKVMRSKHPRKTLMAQVDTIAHACMEMHVRLQDGTLKPLRDVIPGRTEPVRYDNTLGEFLGFDPEGSARRAVMATFNNDLAIPIHHNELAAWMQLSLSDTDEDF